MVRDSLRGFRTVMVAGSSVGPYIAAAMADAMRIIRWYRRCLAEYSRLSLCGEYLRAIGRRNAVFVWIPKNAGSRLHRLVGGSRLLDIHAVCYRFAVKGMVTFGHMDYAMLVDRGFVFRRFYGSAFKFAFCRNPYDLAVSLFSYLQRGRTSRSITRFWTVIGGLKFRDVNRSVFIILGGLVSVILR